MAMPKKPIEAKNKTTAFTLPPRLLAIMDEERQPGESKSAQARRLLVKALGLQDNELFKKY